MKKYILGLSIALLFSCKKEPQLVKTSGLVFGTTYNIKYYDATSKNFQKQFEAIFNEINKSMSNYQANSDISRINKNEVVEVDHHFKTVFKAAKQIYRETQGVFDPTIGKLVNAWNFGSETNKTALDSTKIDSLMRFVGFNKVGLINNTIKKPKQVFIDFNAIAKGYAVDVIAHFLNAKQVNNYIVDIGGELRAKGINIKHQKHWTVGIEKPNFDGSRSFTNTMMLKNEAMATSGTYRKFKIDENGNRYDHIINTKTGYSTKTNILGVSVIAENCMMADGYATAFQAMGINALEDFMNKHKALKAYIIFENNDGKIETKAFNNFPVDN